MDLKIIEDALQNHPNRFELTMMAVARARELNEGESVLHDKTKGEKPAVIALEEIAAGALVPGTKEEMVAIREARRIAREKALMEADDKETGEEEGESMNVASPDGPSSS
ncbi:DNA-directed RNA polymerase subunit omega [bacterium]|nr:MAG: DNA-directed RNA polymerase subunit omega [bacterium]